MSVEWKCPDCGHINNLPVSIMSSEEVRYCDSDGGGCDQRFFVQVKPVTNISVQVSRLVLVVEGRSK